MHMLYNGFAGAEGTRSFMSGLTVLWVFSAAVSAMNSPDANSSKGYRWLYRFTHLLAANLDRAWLVDSELGATENKHESKEIGG